MAFNLFMDPRDAHSSGMRYMRTTVNVCVPPPMLRKHPASRIASSTELSDRMEQSASYAKTQKLFLVKVTGPSEWWELCRILPNSGKQRNSSDSYSKWKQSAVWPVVWLMISITC